MIAETTLVSPDHVWPLLAVLLGAAALGLWGERTRWGSRISGAVITILATFALSNLSVIPTAAPLYDIISGYLLQLAIPLLLLKADLRKIFREAGPTLIAFLLGALGTVIGVMIAFWLIPLGEQGPGLAGTFCATYVGGGVNYTATAKLLELSPSNFAAGMAADNLAMTAYFLLLFALPSVAWLRRGYPDRPLTDTAQHGEGYWESRKVALMDLAIALAIAATACFAGTWLQDRTGYAGTGILFTTALVVAAATLFPRHLGKIEGADTVGTYMMMTFFAVIGASASIWLVIEKGPMLLVFAAVILGIHLVFLLIAGKLLRLDLRELVVASNANMGGPTSAAAMAVSRRWDGLVVPAVLCGTLGYAIATFMGTAIGRWLA